MAIFHLRTPGTEMHSVEYTGRFKKCPENILMEPRTRRMILLVSSRKRLYMCGPSEYFCMIMQKKKAFIFLTSKYKDTFFLTAAKVLNNRKKSRHKQNYLIKTWNTNKKGGTWIKYLSANYSIKTIPKKLF